MLKKAIGLLAVSAITIMLAACDMPVEATTQSPSNQAAAEHNQQMADEQLQGVSATNAERDNIIRRVKLTSTPGLLGYVLLYNPGSGNPALYTTVKGKITSGDKRIHNTEQLVHCDKGEYWGDCNMPAPGDEGTFGNSGDYIYFWTEDGQYIQWNGNYLYSDKPFRIPPNSVTINMVNKK